MTIVLTILAVLTTLAITLADGTIDQARFDATRRQLQTIQDAILGPAGQPDSASFVADVGRLPLVGANPDDPLPELTSPMLPAGMLAFAARNATEDTDVVLYCGWRGPYASFPVGPTGLRDGWGQQFVATTQPTSAGAALLNLASIGGPNAPYAGQPMSLPTPLTGLAWSGPLAGNLVVHSNSGTAPANLSVRLFVPDMTEADGVRMLSPSSGDPTPSGGNVVSYPFSFASVPMGLVALRAYQGLGPDKSNTPSTVSYVRLTPRGTPAREIHLYIP